MTSEKMSRIELFHKREEASAYLDKKGVRMACLHHRRIFGRTEDGGITDLTEVERNEPNVLYVLAKKSFVSTPVDNKFGGLEGLEKARADGQLLAEIPFAGESGWDSALLKAAEIVKANLGAVTLSDVVDVSYADKSEIKKLITRLKKSTRPDELSARAEELQDIISQYKDRLSDTEREDLQEKLQSIVEALENGQQELEKGDKESAVSEIEEALFQ